MPKLVKKKSEEMITLSKKDLFEIYQDAVKIRNMSVFYKQDQLEMANQAIFQMQGKADGIANYFWNKGIR